ncbi:uncharacterized protein LOC117107042 [Anneissia japonica]|uniref:uncharacterized protein LOC117107042 n=1 Tax=Anneissia japonica TaxID=1529436 RepID=UPI0014254E8D|nr:uncharacterized protein LOC117107042 [Anneissia japonica]
MQHHWTKCILVLACKMVMVSAPCPSGFTCSGMTSCYLIYPSNNGWKFQDPNGDTHSSANDVYSSPNCYKFIKLNGAMQSCIDTQRECKKLGGNITVINSIEEYEQLTEVVVNIMKPFQDRNFNVHNQKDGISNGCATITVEDELFINDDINMVNTDYFKTHLVDAIACESSGIIVGDAEKSDGCSADSHTLPKANPKSTRQIVNTSEADENRPDQLSRQTTSGEKFIQDMWKRIVNTEIQDTRNSDSKADMNDKEYLIESGEENETVEDAVTSGVSASKKDNIEWKITSFISSQAPIQSVASQGNGKENELEKKKNS